MGHRPMADGPRPMVDGPSAVGQRPSATPLQVSVLVRADFNKNTFFSQMSSFAKSWLWVFWPTESFLRPWEVIYKKWKFCFVFTFSARPDFSHFSNFLVCYNSYQGLSWTRISSRFLFYIKSYIDSTIQILKMICLRLRGEKSLMIKWCFLMCALSAEYYVILTIL